MKLPTFLASLASSSLLALAACGGGGAAVDLDAKFSTADQAHLERAAMASLGMDYGMAFFIGAAMSSGQSACPRVAIDGSTVTIQGGCTDDSGTRYEGRAVLDNVPGLFGDNGATIDPAAPQVLDFDGFSIVSPDDPAPLLLDGHVELDRAAGHVSTDLSTTIAGLLARSVLELACTAQGQCTAEAGSEIAVDGVGGAAVSGTWQLQSQDDQGNDLPPSGAVTLTGAETMVIDVGGADASGCLPYSIDGAAAGTLCGQ